MNLCRDKAPLDFGDPCVRALWETSLPSLLVVTLYFFSTPISSPIRKVFKPLTRKLRPFLALQEAEALGTHPPDGPLHDEDYIQPDSRPVSRRVLTLVGAVEGLCWLVYGVYLLVDNVEYWWRGSRAFAFAAAWLYAAIVTNGHRRLTPPYDVFAIYLTLLVAGLVGLGGVLYDNSISAVPPPDGFSLGMISVHLAATMGMLTMVLSMPLAVPGRGLRKEEIGRTISPENYTSLWGWITFSWVYPLVRKGRHTILNENDVWDLSPTLRSKPLFIKFSETRGLKLSRRIMAANSRDLILDFLLTAVSVGFKYAVIFFLRRVLEEIDRESSSRTSQSKAYVDAFLMFACTVAKAQAEVQHLWFGRHAATRVRSELIAVIYDKALKRKDYSAIVDETGEKSGSKRKVGADVGRIVNLMSGDASQISDTVASAYILFSAPLEVVLAGFLLYRLIGKSSFVGLVILTTCWPLSKILMMRASKVRKEVLKAKDNRMSLLSELIGAVKFIKFFAQEYDWTKRVLDAREKELTLLAKARSKSVRFYLVWSCAPTLVSIASLTVYVGQGNVLSISTIFTAIALFNMVQQPFNTFPGTVASFLSSRRALKRISTFLGEEEVSEQASSLKSDNSTPPPTNLEDELGFVHASFKWNSIPDRKFANGAVNKAQQTPTRIGNHNAPTAPRNSIREFFTTFDVQFELRDLDIRFPPGRLTVITGPTASGKTALLMALLGEMSIISGKILLHKEHTQVRNGLMQSVSYAAQNPWLRKQSIRDNILFGQQYDERRYQAVIEACALMPDLALLEDGDSTRASSLSGGQKSRVALARAVYARTKYVLLDDVFSAVDSRTAQFLYENLLCGPLLAGRTIILVTCHIELVLPAASYFVEMRNGRISSQGTIKDLMARGILDKTSSTKTLGKRKRRLDTMREGPSAEVPISTTAAKAPRRLPNRHETRGFKWSAYWKYLTVSSHWPWVILGISLVVLELLGVSEKLWTKTWGEAYGSFKGSWPDAVDYPYFYVGIYAAIGLAAALTNILVVTAQNGGSLEASRVFFWKLLVTVVGATFRFHDTVPPGQILNRFGRDTEIIDGSLASSLRAVNSSLFGFLAAILTVVAIFPGFLIPGFFIGLAYRRLAIRYLNTGRDLRRMEAKLKAPIFSDFEEVLGGIVTIRAFSVEHSILGHMHKKIDTTTKMWYSFWMANSWLLLNVDYLGALAVLITTLFAIPTPREGAAWAAVSITSSMAFTTSIYWACRYWTDLELDICSVERVVEFLDLPQEPKTISSQNRVPAAWPSSPDIIIENLTVKYDPDLRHALSNVSLHLKAGERIGLLGRTGSGKSTLAMSILRFVDPERGKIIIDGKNISDVGVHDLRSRITFIPQDAPLFSGTLRTNLDPFGEHTDDECLDVIERVQLIGSASEEPIVSEPTQYISRVDGTSARTIPQGTSVEIDSGNTNITLDTRVAAGGTNFSQGQKQLISIARALLRRSAIVILDEGTPSIDPSTAAKIRQTIREEFAGSLLLTVAHRLHTIIDYDRLIVLNDGRVVEFDTPYNLIRKEGGVFREFCLESGSFAKLKAIAKSKAQSLQT